MTSYLTINLFWYYIFLKMRAFHMFIDNFTEFIINFILFPFKSQKQRRGRFQFIIFGSEAGWRILWTLGYGSILCDLQLSNAEENTRSCNATAKLAWGVPKSWFAYLVEDFLAADQITLRNQILASYLLGSLSYRIIFRKMILILFLALKLAKICEKRFGWANVT